MVWHEKVFGRKEVILERQAVAATMGVFDGVHRGHRQLIDELRRHANGLPTVVLTFDPHPGELVGRGALPLIVSVQERVRLLLATGIDAVIVEEFSQELSEMSPQAFCETYLAKHLDLRTVVLGYDFRFGRGREGNLATLAAYGSKFGWAVVEVPPVMGEGTVVSSSEIRRLLMEGDVELASRLLGRPFELTGVTASGEQRGRSMGFPTVNLAPEVPLLVRSGVYVAELLFGSNAGQAWPAVVNIGLRPTFGPGLDLRAEAHIITSGFPGVGYGEKTRFRLRKRLREEKTFGSVDELRSAIQHDVANATRILAARESSV